MHDILPSQTQLDTEIFDEPAGTRYTCYTQPFSLSSYTLKVLLAPLSIYVKDAALWVSLAPETDRYVVGEFPGYMPWKKAYGTSALVNFL